MASDTTCISGRKQLWRPPQHKDQGPQGRGEGGGEGRGQVGGEAGGDGEERKDEEGEYDEREEGKGVEQFKDGSVIGLVGFMSQIEFTDNLIWL